MGKGMDWNKVKAEPLVEVAYNTLVEDLPAPEALLTKAFLLGLAEVPKPRGKMSAEDHKSYQFFLLRYLKGIEKMLLEKQGRLLTNVWGAGYRLAAPRENTQLAEKRFASRVGREIDRAKTVFKKTRGSDLTHQERLEKNEAEMRVGRFEVAFVTYDSKRVKSVDKFAGYHQHAAGLGWSEPSVRKGLPDPEDSEEEDLEEEDDDYSDF